MAAITLNKAERSELISALVTNCDCWDEEDLDILVNMGAEKLLGHVEACAQLIDNADTEDDSGLPDSLEPDSADALEDDAEDEGWEEENLDAGVQPTGSSPRATEKTKKLDQPTKKPEGEEEDNVTENQYLRNLPPRIQSVVVNALKFENEQRHRLIETITANTRNRFSEDYLSELSLNALQGMADLATPQQSQIQPMFLGAAGGPIVNEADVDRDDILVPPVLEFTRPGENN